METEMKYFENVTQEEAEKKAEELNGRILTNKEIDEIIQNDYNSENKIYTLNKNIFPLWTGTKVTHDESGEGTLEEGGKTHKIKLPETGWYEQDEFGMPTKEKSDSSNEKARKIYRRNSKHSGLVVRNYFFGDFSRRNVGCNYGASYRFGVLIEVKKKKVV